jgi:hypothetical protein
VFFVIYIDNGERYLCEGGATAYRQEADSLASQWNSDFGSKLAKPRYRVQESLEGVTVDSDVIASFDPDSLAFAACVGAAPDIARRMAENHGGRFADRVASILGDALEPIDHLATVPDYGQDMTREGPIEPAPVTAEDIERDFPGAMAADAAEVTSWYLTINGRPLCAHTACMAGMEQAKHAAQYCTGADTCSQKDFGYACDAADAWRQIMPGAAVDVLRGPCPESEPKRAGTVDLTPTWSGVGQIIQMGLEHGTDTGRQAAREELRHLASVADIGNEALSLLDTIRRSGTLSATQSADVAQLFARVAKLKAKV